MAPPSSRPLTTYSRRRTRPRQPSQTVSQTSPIRPLSPDTDDVSFALMAHRMNKRARLAAHSSTTDASHAQNSADESREDRPSKRTKALLVEHSQLTLGDDPMTGDYMLDNFTQTSLQLSTPVQAVPSDFSMALSSAMRPSTAAERLSPLPVAKRILSRTTSRNFKENASQRGSRSLASPFNSRPGSRAASPKQRSKHRRGHHAKSRTLSQSGALKEKVVDRNISSALQTNANHSSHAVATNASQPDTPGKVLATAHTRASSIPTLKPALDHLSPEAWLVPPKVLSRNPPAADSDTEGDALQNMNLDLEHPSFYRDAPQHISTPPRRVRSATVGAWAYGLMPQIDAGPPPPVHSFSYDSEVDMTDSSRAGSPSDSRPTRANPPRRRRRTIVHLPSDSLFSSSLDFSALMSETERFPRPPASEGSGSPQQNLPVANSDLAPAFSLHNSPVGSSLKAKSAGAVTLARRGSSRSGFFTPADVNDKLSPSGLSSHPGSARLDAAVDGDELLDMFSVLGLDEDEKWGPPAGADDSGIAFSTASVQAQGSQPPPSKGGRVRRKRGDTIRAADFARMPASASLDGSGSSGSALAAAQRVPPRRTRSGTVTQNTSSGSGRRKQEGWPTIKMRTMEEPLRVDGDDADDELLLKDGDVVD